jgi:SdrD B-like domain/Calx-beta domain
MPYAPRAYNDNLVATPAIAGRDMFMRDAKRAGSPRTSAKRPIGRRKISQATQFEPLFLEPRVLLSSAPAMVAHPAAVVLGPGAAPYIAGTAFYDDNGDGILQQGENAFPNIEVDLLSGTPPNGTVFDRAITDANGNYSFTNLPDGSYYVHFVLPTLMLFSPQGQGNNPAAESYPDPTTGNTAAFAVSAQQGTQDGFVNVGMHTAQPLAFIGGTVFNDINANGIWEPISNNLLKDPGFEPDATTGLPTANGKVSMTQGGPWLGTQNNDPPFNGYYTNAVSRSGTQSGTTYSGPSGTIFQNVVGSPGLAYTASAYFDNRAADPLINDETDTISINFFSGFNGTGTMLGTVTGPITVNANSPLDTWTPISVTGTAPGSTQSVQILFTFNNPEGDTGSMYVDDATLFTGTSGTGAENGIPGVTVNLEDATSTVVATTTTDANGYYSFSKILNPGPYFVQVVAPANYYFSPEQQGFAPTIYSWVDSTTGVSIPISVEPGPTPATGPALLDTAATTVNAGLFTETITVTSPVPNPIARPQTGTVPAVFTVTISPVNNATVLVPFTTQDGTATNTDYQPQSGTLTFPPGVTSQTVTVLINGNTTIENDVTFFVVLTNPGGFTTPTLIASATIQNTNFPVATINNSMLTRPNTGTGEMPFVITLSAAAPFDVDVPYTTADNTAVAGTDYTLTSGDALFPAGQTAEVIFVPITGSTTPTLDKSFFVNLTASSTVTLGTPSQGVGTIVTNSPPQLNVADASVTESLTGLALLPFVITITPSLPTTNTINYATADGTAIANVDYGPMSGQLVFAPGQFSQTVYVPVFRQFISAQDKTLTMTVSDAGNTLSTVKGVATGTIHYVSTVALAFDAKHKATYKDYLHNNVNVTMHGPGTGSVVFLGTISTDTDAFEILLDGSTPASSLSVGVSNGGQTAFHNLIVTGAAKSISAPTTNVLGIVSSTGSVSSMHLGYLQGSTITIGSGGAGSVAFTFNRVLDTTITSAIPITSLNAQAYINTDGIPDVITAPTVGKVKVQSTFGGTINTATLTSLQVGRLNGAVITTTGSIGTITANGITGSTIFAGVISGLATLPASQADFANQSAKISTVTVRSGGFSNTLIAAWSMNMINLGKVQTSNNAITFGVAATRITSVKAFANKQIHLKNLDNPAQTVTVADFTVRLVSGEPI